MEARAASEQQEQTRTYIALSSSCRKLLWPLWDTCQNVLHLCYIPRKDLPSLAPPSAAPIPEVESLFVGQEHPVDPTGSPPENNLCLCPFSLCCQMLWKLWSSHLSLVRACWQKWQCVTNCVDCGTRWGLTWKSINYFFWRWLQIQVMVLKLQLLHSLGKDGGILVDNLLFQVYSLQLKRHYFSSDEL